ncbi:aspartyl/glutamyl-tRNA amidotransferase subunit A [Pseudomonas fragi]|uniref:Aspartyl/glutamyl-tRNA amidotransferase subunit A n=1 Tax=Pseudomonas fragi TaxID=296 RepID=A0A449IG11_PSEFR|nr:aspartyl/glutamyl-tRNA amidotransferase subunit A [Pseudomonas fragi]
MSFVSGWSGQAAALTNLTGLKPTYGRVSRWGMIAYASSLDQAGPLARTAEDCAILLQGMAGFDPQDSTSIDEPVPDFSTRTELHAPLEPRYRVAIDHDLGDALRGVFDAAVGRFARVTGTGRDHVFVAVRSPR